MLGAMKNWLFLLLVCVSTFAACQSAPLREGDPAPVDIPNFRVIAPGISSGGQLEVAQLGLMKPMGYSTVINLRPDSEDYPKNESLLAEQAGLAYYQIPVTGSALTMDSAYELQRVLSEAPDGHVLIHCRSGARVGAIWGMYQAVENGLDADAAVQAAWDAGVRKQGLVDQVQALVANMQ